MAALQPSSSRASTSSSHRRRRVKWTTEQLKQSLQLLSQLSTPLPPTLPPSPPASRSSSPTPGAKRKHSSKTDPEHSKRVRVSERPAAASRSAPTTSRINAAASSSRYSAPREDGEVYEDDVPASSTRTMAQSSLPSDVPVRRPKASRPSAAALTALHDRWYGYGRALKFSGDARYRSTYAPGHQHYSPLPKPPPTNSSYHKHGALIARLESIDSLLCFTYAMWCKDMSQSGCSIDNWRTLDPFLTWCKGKWSPEQSVNSDESENAFFGLIWMIEAFIKSRTQYHAAKILGEQTVGPLFNDAIAAVEQAADAAERNASKGGQLTTGSATPHMLPSPASIASASANSTPTSRSNGTPELSTAKPATTKTPPSAPQPLPVSSRLLPNRLRENHQKGVVIDRPVLDAVAAATVPVAPNAIASLRDFTFGAIDVRNVVNQAQTHLTLPIMARCFPRTFTRMVHSTLNINDEYAPDIEDEEGELFWPGQALNGEGIGWVCLMGKAMVQEFGKPYGYLGLKGAVPKQ